MCRFVVLVVYLSETLLVKITQKETTPKICWHRLNGRKGLPHPFPESAACEVVVWKTRKLGSVKHRSFSPYCFQSYFEFILIP